MRSAYIKNYFVGVLLGVLIYFELFYICQEAQIFIALTLMIFPEVLLISMKVVTEENVVDVESTVCIVPLQYSSILSA